MTTLSEARQVWKNTTENIRGNRRIRSAVLGNGLGSATSNVEVPGRSFYVYARDSMESDHYYEILNLNTVRPAINLPVLVGYPSDGTEEQQVLGLNYSGLGSEYTIEDVTTIGQHHWQHEFQGGDQITVDPRQFNVGLIYPTNPPSMKVQIGEFLYFWNEWKQFTLSLSRDLTQFRPSSGKYVNVTIALDPETDQIRYHVGFPGNDGAQVLDGFSAIPAPGGNEIPLGYVQLTNSTTSLDWTTTNNNIGTARMFLNHPWVYALDKLRQLEGYTGNDPNLATLGAATNTTDDPIQAIIRRDRGKSIDPGLAFNNRDLVINGAGGGTTKLTINSPQDNDPVLEFAHAASGRMQFFFATGTGAGSYLEVLSTGGVGGVAAIQRWYRQTGVVFMQFSVGINNLTPAARLHITASAVGNEIMRLDTVATNDDPTESIFQNRLSTANAANTTLHTIAIPASTVVQIESNIVARRTDGAFTEGAGYSLFSTAHRLQESATLIGNASTVVASNESDSLWNSYFDSSGNDIRVMVSGTSAATITWHSTLRTRLVST